MSCPSAEQLASLAEGALDATAVVHVETCAACQEVIRIVRQPNEAIEVVEADSSTPAPGDSIGRYVVLRAVAQGGMGQVYLGYDPVLDRNLALKLVRADRSSPDFAARLAREAQVLAKLAHPNVVRVFDAGTWRGDGYVAMEYLDGESVRTWCKTGERSVADMLRVFIGAARGIGAAHALGVVHRDIKPDNILVGRDGAGRIADFGLVSTLDDRDPVAGTVGYRAPEVVAGGVADERSDQWSLCAALCEILYGERPTSAESIAGTGARPRALRRGLAADPSRRFASIDELADALERRPRVARYVAVGAVLALIAVGAAALRGREDPNAACGSEGRAAVADAAPLEGDPFRRRFEVFGAGAELRRAATARELASYTTRLSASAVGACRARSVNTTAAALQRDCVTARRRELAALAGALQTIDRVGLEQAVSAIAKLPDPALCDDPARLASIVAIEPARRAEADALAGEAAALRARWLLGARDGVLPIARAFADRGERLGATIAVTTSGLYADILGERGEMAAAAEAHLTAARHAARARDDRSVAVRMIRAAGVAAIDLAFDRANVLLTSAEIIALRVHDPSLQDELDRTKAELALQRGDSQAVELARGLTTRLRGRGAPEYFNSMFQLARALFNAKQRAESRSVAQSALAEITASFGADHPYAMLFHTHLGKLAIETDQLDEASTQLARALEIARAAHRTESLPTADALMNLSAIRALQHRDAEAITLGKQGLAIAERLGSRRLSYVLATLATLYIDTGNVNEGLPLLQRSIALREELYGPDSGELLRPLIVLGMASADARDLGGARKHWHRAVAILNHMANPPDFGVDLLRDLASIEAGPTRKLLLADADALKRRLATRAKLAAER